MVWWLTLALAGDVWMQVEVDDDGQQVRLDLPVNGLVAEGQPAPARTEEGRAVDLRTEVKALQAKRAGVTRRYVVEEDDGDRWPVVLSTHEPAAPVDTLAVSVTAPGGFSLTFDLPLNDEAGKQLEQSVDVDLGPPGVALDLDAANEAQLRRGGERTLMQIVGAQGKGVVVRTARRQPG